MVCGLALAGAVVLLVAEFTTLFTVHTAASSGAVRSEMTGSHHGYALLPLGLASLALAIVFLRTGARYALPAIALLGLVALLIALIADLPDAEATSQLLRVSGGFELANSSPAIGLYLETLGAVLLLVAGVGGLMAIDPWGRRLREG